MHNGNFDIDEVVTIETKDGFKLQAKWDKMLDSKTYVFTGLTDICKSVRDIKMPIDTPLKVSDTEHIEPNLIAYFNSYDKYENEILCYDMGFTSMRADSIACEIPKLEIKHAETVKYPFQYWKGGECPVSDWLIVEVIQRNKSKLRMYAGSFQSWKHSDNPDNEGLDIIGWRLVAGQKLL